MPNNDTPTPFISIQEPTPLKDWDRSKLWTEQPPSIPRTFRDAMEVRHTVFVEEQGIPLEFEFDDDDPRSCHWVVYASINRTIEPEVRDERTGELLQPRKSVTRSQPIATVRLVPFPHPPHPRHGGVYVDNKLTNAGEVVAAPHHGAHPVQVKPLSADEKARLDSGLPFGEDRATDLHDGREPYIKVGRLAVLKRFRRQGVAGLVVREALAWARRHPSFFNPGVRALGVAQLGMHRNGDLPKWNGLLCCHAQETAVKTWQRYGFKADQAMGTWTEEGIPHVGMFLRMRIPPETIIF